MSERYYTTHTFSTNSNHLRLARTYSTVAAAGTFHKLDIAAAAGQNSLVAVQTDFVELHYVAADTCSSAVVVQIDFVVGGVYQKADFLVIQLGSYLLAHCCYSRYLPALALSVLLSLSLSSMQASSSQQILYLYHAPCPVRAWQLLVPVDPGKQVAD